MSTDLEYMQRAVDLALAAEADGNLPIGALIVLDRVVVGEGQSELLVPRYAPGRHAEVGALQAVEGDLWPEAGRMTCYTTLEPCVMCFGTLLLHGVGRVVFGAHDVLGGAGSLIQHLPPYYAAARVFDWEGPLMPAVCDPLYVRADKLFADLPVGRG